MATPLWTPDPDRVTDTNLRAFADAVDVAPDDLHRWSVDHPGDFWRAAWDRLGVVGDPGPTAVAGLGTGDLLDAHA